MQRPADGMILPIDADDLVVMPCRKCMKRSEITWEKRVKAFNTLAKAVEENDYNIGMFKIEFALTVWDDEQSVGKLITCQHKLTIAAVAARR